MKTNIANVTILSLIAIFSCAEGLLAFDAEILEDPDLRCMRIFETNMIHKCVYIIANRQVSGLPSVLNIIDEKYAGITNKGAFLIWVHNDAVNSKEIFQILTKLETTGWHDVIIEFITLDQNILTKYKLKYVLGSRYRADYSEFLEGRIKPFP